MSLIGPPRGTAPGAASEAAAPIPPDAEADRLAARDLPLVEAATSGDREAFGHLYDLYGRMVHGVLLSRVPREEVDDLVQDVFIQAMERLNTLREPGAFGGWLAAIARNRATDYYRKPATRASHVEWSELPEAVMATQESVSEKTQAIAVLNVIRTMPEAYRETLVLRLVEGMTGPEIAARTGLTPASVRVNLHRGMKQLREKLEGRS
ncbi:MAG: sigma-70 family RNA polymerase sigma factor [Acidobacteria bacterium]|nr:sigma-70 family RNA polymerase sigma factor [Acidobacteriota bacterium]MBI3264169.1 sigma-70 family RNA polymerase sigma factor [Acidobacteriota bacterium]